MLLVRFPLLVLFCVSSKSSITFSHGAQGMAFSGRPRWLGSGHSRATSAVSEVATCFAGVSSRSSASTLARRKSGTKRASDPRFAMLWRGQRERSTQQQQCGEGRCCQPTDKASNCWGRRWAILTSLPGTSGPSRKSIKSSCNEFHA